jgi:hypothetical protein
MAWFLNHYECARCHTRWTDEWSCMCDDDCPQCGARHMSPCDAEDLTEIITEEGGFFVILRSSDTAEHGPAYRERGRFRTRRQAEAFLASG